jgi:hypothetical protein
MSLNMVESAICPETEIDLWCQERYEKVDQPTNDFPDAVAVIHSLVQQLVFSSSMVLHMFKIF